MPILPVAADDPQVNIVTEGKVYNQKDKRGLNVQSLGDVVVMSGRMEDGRIGREYVQQPYFSLTPLERDEIAKQNSYVQGIITGRMHRIAGIDWKVIPKAEVEDDFVQAMKMRKQIIGELRGSTEIAHKILALKYSTIIRNEIPGVLPDLSNFDMALRRWRKLYRKRATESASQVEDWIQQANDQDDFEEFQKKWIYDLMIHGSSSIYWDTKSVPDKQTFYMLPGGTVMPVRNPYAGPGAAWVQQVPGYETKLYFRDEIVHDIYVPISSRSYGVVPLDALVNKVAESLLFDQMAAERADGTKPPEKAVIFGDRSPLSGFGGTDAFMNDVPLPQDQQRKLEQKLNTERQNAIAVLSGVGTPIVMDLSRADTFQAQSERQIRLLKDIALVFNVSNNEINETGSEGTSGRSVSESLERIDKEKGIGPLIRIIDKTMTSKILPRRFGSYWRFEHNDGLSETQQVQMDAQKLQSGTYSINEIREERGDDLFEGEQFDAPQGAGGNQPGVNQMNPLFTQALE